MVTWEPQTATGKGILLKSIVGGRHDRYIRKSAEAAAAWHKPILLRFAQEMNGGWYPWGFGVGGNTPRLYRKAWHHVYWIFRNHGASNVKWVWSPNEDAGGGHPLAVFYPGDEFVDWVGIDGFCWGGTIGWPSFTKIFGSTYDRIVKLTSKPILVAETGAERKAATRPNGSSSTSGREAPGFSHIRALVWFDGVDSHADLRVDSSPASLAAFRAAIASPRYAGTRTTLLATPATLPPGCSGARPAQRRIRSAVVLRRTAPQAPREVPAAGDRDRGGGGSDRDRRDARPSPDPAGSAGLAGESCAMSPEAKSDARGGVADLLVLCYHAVSDTWPSPAAIAPARLRAQLRFLLGRGHRPMTLSAALGETAPRKAMVVTFDDAYASILSAGLPVLEELGVPATVFVPTDAASTAGRMSWSELARWVGGEHEQELRCMSWDELRKLSDRGWEVGSHTCSHRHLTELGKERGGRAAPFPRRLRGRAATPCHSLAYPFGSYDRAVMDIAAAAGYRAAVTLDERIAESLRGRGPLEIPREAIYRETGWPIFLAKTSRSVRRLRASKVYASLS